MLPRDFDPDGPGTGDGIFGLPFTAEEAGVVLIPVPWEATVSYGTGAAAAPEAIRAASQQVDLYDRETGRPYHRGIHLLPHPTDVAAWSDEARIRTERILEETGGIGAPAPIDPDHPLAPLFGEIDALGERLNAWVETEATRWREAGKLVGLVGGDHSSPFGAIRAAARSQGSIGVLQVDAHADLRDAYMGFTWSHASIFHNVLERIPGVARLVQVGIRDLGSAEAARIDRDPDRIRTFFDADLQRRTADGEPWTAIARTIVDALPGRVYVSIDIDGLDPSLCPHTGTPVPGGLSFHQLTALLRELAESGREIVGFDLCEVAPDPEGRSEWDANVGARVLYKLIGFSLASRPK